jgi:hypothetical protein
LLLVPEALRRAESRLTGALSLRSAEFTGVRDKFRDEVSADAFALICPDQQAVKALGYLDAMTNENLIEEAGRRLAKAAPGARVILFGSRARLREPIR